MPGAYIDGDVEGVEFFDGTNSWISGLPFNNQLINFKSGGPSHIYTWDNTTTAKRGPGGNPTQSCAGDKQN
jgi:hypothetical protein